jgi:hypothetical protein
MEYLGIQEAMQLGYKFVYIKTAGGRIIRKLMMQRIPDPGERIGLGTDILRVTNIMTILATEGKYSTAGYDVPVATYVVFVEYL